MINNELKRSTFLQNPVFGLAMGLCPALAITTNLKNATGLGIAALCVLVASSFSVSLARRWIPYKVRIPCYLIIIASFVSMADIVMKSHQPLLSANLGIFVPLLAVNCVFIDRAESFASRNKAGASIVDALGTGLGFFLSLVLCALIRESLGANRLFGVPLIPHFEPMRAMLCACGGFFSIALVLGISGHMRLARGKKR
jgi:electron transport complex protein RnfE